ncbi:MAG: ion channel [Clostridia bacterium]|nr:ion channel [Clostridia bacterium]
MKRRSVRIAAVAAAYLVLVALVALAERNAGGPIRGFGDALWYSLVTMTTVGYGDLYPVTACGKALGTVFLLASLGFLAFVLSSLLSLMSGKWIPGIRLFLARKRPWFVFTERNAAAEALAADLMENRADAVTVYLGETGRCTRNVVFFPEDAAALAEKPCFGAGERTLFPIAEDAGANRAVALQLKDTGCRICCRGPETAGMPGVTFFDAHETCARGYWQKHTIRAEERCIALVGDGAYAEALLDRAVLSCCMTPFAVVSYRMFGDWAEYRAMHPGLAQCFALGETSETQDSLLFPGRVSVEALKDADRILLCGDDRRANAALAVKLARLLPGEDRLHVLTDDPTVPGVRFGSDAELFTEALVLKHAQDRTARAMHESYRATAQDAPAWEELSPFLKASNRAVADHLQLKARLLKERNTGFRNADESLREQCRENEHDRWMRFHSLYNYTYGEQKDRVRRTHPCMVPYARLGAEEQRKDDAAWLQLSKEKEE